MADDRRLASVLSEFAHTLATAFPIQAILDQFVEQVVEVLPVTGAGVTLITADLAPRYVAASDVAAMHVEWLQTGLREGPCLATYGSGEPVLLPNLTGDDRFPRFAPAAAAAGIASAFSFPLRQGDSRLGALDLYRDLPGMLAPHDIDVAQTLADVATAYLVNAEARDEAQASAELFRQLALHDPVTGLPNRALLHERLRRIASARTLTAALFIDLDRFREVDDAHGVSIADELLSAVARRLDGLSGAGETLVRYSGCEFVVLCEGLASRVEGHARARHIHDSLTRPFPLAGTQLTVSPTIGIAYADPGEWISEQLVVDASIAMYELRREAAGDSGPIDVPRTRPPDDRHGLESDLRFALAQDDLDLAYQPIVRSADGLVTGVEALLRWTHPERGPMPPISIVRLAEQTGLIDQIGTWVLQRGCRDYRRWVMEHPDLELDLSINVSVRQLTDPMFVTAVSEALAGVDMSPTDLILEVTESILIDDAERAIATLTELSRLGVRIALDDFGTGYSSLSYLRQLPIDILKIDRSFVTPVARSLSNRAIVTAITDLAHALGLSVTAEGVETVAQHRAIAAIGCASAQGYLYARPLSEIAIRTHLDVAGAAGWYLPGSDAERSGSVDLHLGPRTPTTDHRTTSM